MTRPEESRRLWNWRVGGRLLAILACAAASDSAPAQLLGPEIQVNSYTTGAQAGAQVAADRTGKFVVVWQSDGQDGDGAGVFGQRFDANDLLLGGEFQVHQYTTEHERGPVVAIDGGGGFVVTWSNYPSRKKIVSARRYDPAGLALGDEFQVSSYTTLVTTRAVDVAADEAGNFTVLWYYEAPWGAGLLVNGGLGQRFDAAAQPVGAPFSVGGSSLSIFGFADAVGGDSLAMTAPGEFVVGERTTYGGYPGPEWNGPAVQRFDGAGEVGSLVLVQSYTTMAAGRVRVASAGAGDFVVSWDSHPYYGFGAQLDILARRIDANGSPLGEEFLVNTYTSSHQWGPEVAADRKGNFLVVWQSPDQDGSDKGLFGQRFAADGSRIGGEFQVNSYTTGAQSLPSVAAGNVGDFIVAWQSDGQDGSGNGVFARRIRSSIFWGGFELGNPCGWSLAVGGGCP